MVLGRHRTGVERDRTLGQCEHRVGLEVGELGMGGCRCRNSAHGRRKSCDINRRSAAYAVEQCSTAQRAQQVLGCRLRHRSTRERTVVEHLGEHAPQPHHHDGAKSLVVLDTDDDLDPTRHISHRLDRD